MPSWALNKKNRALLALIAVSLFFGLFRLGSLPLIDSDEATYARVFHESVQHGDFLSFTKRGDPWLEKPPLYFWTMAVSASVFGENEFALRLPAALFSVLAVLLTYLIALRLTGSWLTAAFSAAVLMTIGAFWDAGRQIRMDVPVAACILFSVYCFIRAMERPKWFFGFGAGIALGVLTKSVIGFFPIPIALLFAAVYRKWDWLKSGWFWLSAALFFLIALPWHIYEYLKFGNDFLGTYWGYHIFQRFSQPILGGSNDNFFYARNLLTQVEPWIFVFLAAVIIFFIAHKKAALKQKQELFVLLAIIFVAVIFVIAKTKLFYYLVPAYPFLAIFVSVIFSPLLRDKKYAVLFGALLVLGAASTALQIFYPETFDAITFPKGVTSKYALAADEKAVGQIVKDIPLPVYLLNWPYRDTLTYYGDAPEFFVVKDNEMPPALSYLLVPSVFVNPNFQGTKNLAVIFRGKVATLLKTK